MKPIILKAKTDGRYFTATTTASGDVEVVEINGKVRYSASSVEALKSFYHEVPLDPETISAAMLVAFHKQKGREAFDAHDWRAVICAAESIEGLIERRRLSSTELEFSEFEGLVKCLLNIRR
jgi:hypothetical protein